VINPVEFWDENDSIDPNPASPLFLDQSKRAAEIFSGLDKKSPLNGTLPPDRPGQPFFNPFNQTAPATEAVAQTSSRTSQDPIADRFGTWGSTSVASAPVASDDPASFVDRFGNWASVPGGVLGNVGAGVSAPASRSSNRDQRSEITDDVTPPSTVTNDNNAPSLAPSSSPQSLGIFSGKPMRNYPVPPPIFRSADPPSTDDDELFRRWKAWIGD
jgi:hypothetical protein